MFTIHGNLMEKPKEKCPECGKKYKFLKKHMKRAHSSIVSGKIIPDKVQEISKEKSNSMMMNSPAKSSSSFLKEINLQGEYNKMEETVNPKKSEDKESKTFKCGSCGGTFKEKIKRCPHCGVEFE
jgi:rubrerythrin